MPKIKTRTQFKDLPYSSEKRAESALNEAVGLLKSFYPSVDFEPGKYVQRMGRVLRVPVWLPF